MDFLIFKGGSLLLFSTWWLMSDGVKAVLLGVLGRTNRVANHGGTLQGERTSLSYHELHETEEKKMLQINILRRVLDRLKSESIHNNCSDEVDII